MPYPWTPDDVPGPGFDPAQSFAFLDDPRIRGAMLQAGLQLMQPPSFGDTGVSQIGRAIGAGGESVARQEAQDIKRTEADSRQELRTAQAAAAGAKAETAGAKLDTAAQRLQLQRFAIEQLNERNASNQRMRANLAYSAYLQKEMNNPLRTKDTPVMTREEFDARVGIPPGPVSESAVMGGVDASGLPSVPVDPADRVPGQTYAGKSGPAKWTGTGWVRP